LVVPGTVVANAFIMIKFSLKSKTGGMGSIQEKKIKTIKNKLPYFKMFL
jgi:hypothetical protein